MGLIIDERGSKDSIETVNFNVLIKINTLTVKMYPLKLVISVVIHNSIVNQKIKISRTEIV